MTKLPGDYKSNSEGYHTLCQDKTKGILEHYFVWEQKRLLTQTWQTTNKKKLINTALFIDNVTQLLYPWTLAYEKYVKSEIFPSTLFTNNIVEAVMGIV